MNYLVRGLPTLYPVALAVSLAVASTMSWAHDGVSSKPDWVPKAHSEQMQRMHREFHEHTHQVFKKFDKEHRKHQALHDKAHRAFHEKRKRDEKRKHGKRKHGERVEFSETKVLIEINASDGDAGFHVLLDADAWEQVGIDDPKGKRIFKEQAKGNLRKQGLTENFFESAEPLCRPDPEEPDARVVPLAKFLKRFPVGDYVFTGKTIEGDRLKGTAELTHALPAAPKITSFDGSVVTWQAGSDLGNCQDDDLVAYDVIPDPATVEVVGWEVVVEPADDEAADPLRIFSVQLPPDVLSVTVPAEFINAYLADGVTEFKIEVGAIEESGNQTFSEEEFDID